MVRSQRPPVARGRLAVAVVLALLASGCGGHSNVQFASSGSPATGVSTGGSVSVQGHSTLAVLFAIAILSGASNRGDPAALPFQRAPEMDPARRVAEQDCTRPIEDWSSNLKCR